MISLKTCSHAKGARPLHDTSRGTNGIHGRQRGVILLLIVVGLFLVSSSIFLTVLNNNMSTLAREQDTTAALLSAKEALIAFALLSEDHFSGVVGPGHLFCPDTNGNGLPNNPCAGGLFSFGRLPQSINTDLGDTLLSNFNAGLDEQFWFAIDNSVRSDPASQLNSSTVSNITVNGVGGIAAVLIAPGGALGSQVRSNNTAANYLEGTNTGGPAFAGSNEESSETFNDRVLTIEYGEIMTPVTSRVAHTIKGLLDTYRGVSGSYPDDTSFDDPMLDDFTTVVGGAPAWFGANDWLNQTTYVRLNTDSATLVFNGCGITYTVSLNTDTTRDARQC